MKKFFSAILLMTMMVFSVGTFVSCNDLVEEVEDIKNQTNVNAGAISDLESALTALQAKLASDYATKQELDAAKTALQGALDTEVADLEGQIAKINDAIAAINDAQKADADALANLSKLVDEAIAAVQASVKELADAQAALKANTEANAGAIADLAARMTAAETAIKDIQAAAETFKTDIEALKTATMQNTEVITNLSVAYTNFQEVTEERLDKAEANIEALEAYVDQMVAEIYGRIETVEEALSAVANLVADLETEDTAIYKEIEKLQESVSAVNNLINDLDAEDVKIYKEIEGALAAVSAVNALIEDLKNEDTQIYQQFNSLQETLSTVIMAVADLETVVAEIEDRLAAQEAALKAEVAALKETDAEAKKELDALKAAKDALDEKVADLEEKVLAFADAETVNAALDALKADAEAAKTALDEINNKLNNLSGIVDAIVNQIQDVNFVPTSAELGAKLATIQYKFGKNSLTSREAKSPVMIMATYEVRPAAAVEALVDANLQFSTVETKVAAAEYFDAKIVDRDAATGRMIVVGYIDEDSKAFDKFANTRFALNINVNRQFTDEDGAPVLPEVGSYVTSEYLPAATKPATATAVPFAVAYTKDGDIEYAGADDAVLAAAADPAVTVGVYEVPYTPTGEATSQVLFENFLELVVDFDGTYLPLDKASEVLQFGFELEAEYAEFKTYNNAGKRPDQTNKVSPITLTGTGFEIVATNTGSADYTGGASVGQYATVKVEKVTVNGVDAGFDIAATYKIGYTKADITLTGETIKWSYKYGDEIKGTYNVSGNEFPGLGSAAELDVDGSIDDITVLKLGSPTGSQFSPTETLTFTAVEDGQTVATVDIISLSKKAVRIVGGKIPFVQGESHTYKFNALLYDANKKEYTLSFEITTDPMPENKSFDLGTIEVGAKFQSEMTKNISPVAAFMAEDAEFYADVNSTNKADFYTQVNAGPTLISKVWKGNEELTGLAPNFDLFKHHVTATWNYSPNSNPALAKDEETSCITIDQASIGDVYTYEFDKRVFGVTYTYTLKVEVKKATAYGLEINPLHVAKQGETNLVSLDHGTVKIPTAQAGVKKEAGKNYELQEIDLRDYVKVTGESNADRTNKENKIVYKVLTELDPDDDSTTDNNLKGDYVAAISGDDCTSTAAEAYDQITKQLIWGSGAALYNNEVKVLIALMPNNAADGIPVYSDPQANGAIVYDSEIITIRVPELVTLSAIEPVYTARKKEGAYSVLNTTGSTPEWSAVNVVRGLKATTVDGTILYNKIVNEYNNTLDLTYFWKVQESTGSSTFVNWFEVFGQTEPKVPAIENGVRPGVKAYLQNSPSVTLDYGTEYLVKDDGTVELATNNSLPDNVIVEVPVTINHWYCPLNTLTVVVKVLFVK